MTRIRCIAYDVHHNQVMRMKTLVSYKSDHIADSDLLSCEGKQLKYQEQVLALPINLKRDGLKVTRLCEIPWNNIQLKINKKYHAAAQYNNVIAQYIYDRQIKKIDYYVGLYCEGDW